MLVPLALAAKIHDIAGLALCSLYAFFVVANIISGNWWQHVPKPKGFLEKCRKQIRFYAFGIFRGKPHGRRHTNLFHGDAPHINDWRFRLRDGFACLSGFRVLPAIFRRRRQCRVHGSQRE